MSVNNSVMMSQRCGGVQNATSVVAQLSQQRTTELQPYRYALVLAVELPTGFSGSLRSPVGDLSNAEGAYTSEVARLCRIIYHDGSVPAIPVPTRVGTAAVGLDRTLIECHRDEDRIAYAVDLTLPIPAPGDIVVIRYEDPENCMGPMYDRMHQETANPGTAAALRAFDMLGGASNLPFNSLEDYTITDEMGENVETQAGGGSIGDGWAINDPEDEFYQRALVYAQHYDDETYGVDEYKSNNADHLAACHEAFLPYAKAFIAICQREGIKVHANSVYRDSAHQARLRANWLTLPEPRPPEPTANTSYHGLGMAFDFNAWYEGTRLHSDPKRASQGGYSLDDWTRSGIPHIVEQLLGCEWGGHWRNYDPIHFDCSSRLDVDKAAIPGNGSYGAKATGIATLAGGEPGVNGNRLDIPDKPSS